MGANTAANFDTAANILGGVKFGESAKLYAPADIVQALQFIGVAGVATGNELAGDACGEYARVNEPIDDALSFSEENLSELPGRPTEITGAARCR